MDVSFTNVAVVAAVAFVASLALGLVPRLRLPAVVLESVLRIDVAVVLMPALVLHGTARLLHNQRALYVKRLLLFEPRVILASVPYRLD